MSPALLNILSGLGIGGLQPIAAAGTVQPVQPQPVQGQEVGAGLDSSSPIIRAILQLQGKDTAARGGAYPQQPAQPTQQDVAAMVPRAKANFQARQAQQQASTPSPQSGSGFDFKAVLGALGPAIATLDPRNAGLGAGLLQANLSRQDDKRKLGVQNQTAKWLMSQGMSPEEASVIASDPAAFRQWYSDRGKPGDAPTTRTGYDEQGREIVLEWRDGQWQQLGGAKAESSKDKFGLVPIYGTKDGKRVLMQPSSTGGVQEVQLPEGVELSPGVDKVDLGTAWGVLDRDGKLVGTIPKDLAGAETQKAAGKAAGEAAGDIPGASTLAQDLRLQVESIKNDPYLSRMLGPWDSRMPNVSGDAARVQSKLDQLQGGAFLQARQMLKGGGQITDYEGQKAEAAFARLNTAQQDQDFKDALDEFLYWTERGLVKLQSTAGQPTNQPAPPASLGGAQDNDPLGIR